MDWSGSGVVSVAGHVEWSQRGTLEPEDARLVNAGDFRWLIAVRDDRGRKWFRSEDAIDCVDDRGTVLATIAVAPDVRR